MRVYAGTEKVRGNEIGGLLRVAATWAAAKYISSYIGIDHLAAGKVLYRAGFSSGTYAYAAITFRSTTAIPRHFRFVL